MDYSENDPGLERLKRRQALLSAYMDAKENKGNQYPSMVFENTGIEPPKPGKLNLAAIPPMRQSIGESDVGSGDMILENDGIEPPLPGELNTKSIPPMTKALTQSDLNNSIEGELLWTDKDVPQLPAPAVNRFKSWEQPEMAPVNRGYNLAEGAGSLISGIGRLMQRKDINDTFGDRTRSERVGAEDRGRSETMQRQDTLNKVREMRDPGADIAEQERQAISSLGFGDPDPEKKMSYEVLKGNRDALIDMMKYKKATKPVVDGVSGFKEPKEDERKALGYHERMKLASDQLAQLGNWTPSIITSWKPEAFKSQEERAYYQAAKNFVTAILRRQSGAVISDSEFETEAKKYLPLPNDGQETLAQKARGREQEIAGMGYEAGNAFAERYGEKPTDRAIMRTRGKLFNPTEGRTMAVASGKEQGAPQIAGGYGSGAEGSKSDKAVSDRRNAYEGKK